MPALDHPRPFCNLSGEELLIVAIRGTPGTRRRVQHELSLRAVLTGVSQRTRSGTVRPRLRLVRGHAA